MTTATVTTTLDHTSDAGFRTWVAEHIAKCAAVGLVQTSDTGQINTSTVTRAGVNADAGYAVFRFNDTQQGTAPVFVKFFYGTAATTSTPRIRAQVGTASNGSGTVSGLGSANTDIIASGAPASTITTYTSYYCCVDGCFWFSWKIGALTATAALSYYMLARSVDNSGVANADAVKQAFAANTPTITARTISYAASTVFGPANSPAWCIAFYGLTSSLVSGSPQFDKAYMIATPRVRPIEYMGMVVDNEIGRGVTLTATPVGTTSRTYINATAIQATGTYGLAAIWE